MVLIRIRGSHVSANFFYKWRRCFQAPTSKFAAFSSTAASRAFDEFPVEENLDNFTHKQSDIKKSKFGIVDKRLTYAKKVLEENLLTDGISGLLVDICAAVGELDFPGCKNSTSWNKLISPMLDKSVALEDGVVANILRACSGAKVAFHFVQQIHAKIINCGLDTSPLVCNPLIDLYLKNEYVDSAIQIFRNMRMTDSVTWVAMISGLSKSCRELEAIVLYREMRKLGVYPTPYIFSSIISACTKIKTYELGEQLHAIILKWGFSSELFVCNSLVALYSRGGNLKFAEMIFGEMKHRDKVSYNTLISGLSMQGLAERSLELFEKMHFESLKPDNVTVACLLGACASTGALLKGIQLHAYATKAGMCSDIIIEGSLLDLYVKCSDIETAHKFFLGTRTDNVVLWNVMLVAYGQTGNLQESFRIYSQMQIWGLQPNQYTYPSILRTCTSSGALDLGEQIHTQVLKTGFRSNAYVCSVLIDMYAKHGKLETARKIFRRLDEDDDIVSWTSMIAGYSQHDMFVEALRIFEEMQERGIRSDNIGLASAISACAGIQALNQGRQIHTQSTVFGYSSDLSIGNALICLYARCGCTHEAHLMFEKMHARDNISWNGMISGFAQSGLNEEAVKVFSRMIGSGEEANLFTYGSAVGAAANLTNVKLGEQIHAKIIKTGYETETEVCNVLITLYSKCGRLNDARRVFFEMPNKNKVSWNAMITGYSQHGYGGQAIELFEDMKKLQIMPNHITYVGVLSACSHVGLVEEGLGYFEDMKKLQIMPKPEHYACVVDVLGRAGQVGRAREFVESMPIKPDAMVWRTLLSACTVHKNTEIGVVAAKHLLELEPKDSAAYVLMSNMYAVTGKWDDRDRARRLMRERGVKKEPGRSWIEVKNSVHAFFVGDRLHPLADEIHKYLEDLNKRVELIGYVRDRNSLWSDLEIEQKDPTAYTHSEKLAVTFGLMSLSSNMMIPLYVMKNLRVCNDCHNWVKFVSKAVGRTIIVRDAYRFHHFQDGVCSCKDYW